jgi:hypothetical protein
MRRKPYLPFISYQVSLRRTTLYCIRGEANLQMYYKGIYEYLYEPPLKLYFNLRGYFINSKYIGSA